jgi:hypothetical protein
VTLIEDRDNLVSGAASMKVDLAATTGDFYCYNSCLTTGIGQTVEVCAYVKKLSGVAATPKVGIWEFNNATCTMWPYAEIIAEPVLNNGAWTQVCKTINPGDWGGTTSSYSVILKEYGDNVVVVFDDVIMLRNEDEHDISCICTGGSSCTCDMHDVSIDDHGLSVGSWTIETDIRSANDWGDATSRYIAYLPGTAGNNNRFDLYFASDVLTFVAYDKTGTAKTATVAAAGNADTVYTVKAVHAADGDIWVCWDGTCGTRVSGAEFDGLSTSLQIGSDGTNGGDLWFQDLKIYNRTK